MALPFLLFFRPAFFFFQHIEILRNSRRKSGAPTGRSRRLPLITRPPGAYGAIPRQVPGRGIEVFFGRESVKDINRISNFGVSI